jgi:uncharacterized protein YecE (DUF72 family)
MELNKSGKIYSGASGLVLPVKNKLSYPIEYQDKSRLTYYASLFNSLEVNSSFYKVPMASTIQKWADSVPENFTFTFKLWREITHNKGLAFNSKDIDHFLARIAHSGEKKGCLLVQFPPSLTIASGASQLVKLLMAIQDADPQHEWKVVLEFRNRSWYHEDIYDLVYQHMASVVVQDLPTSATPLPNEIQNHVYLRFHGPNGGYRGSYSDYFLYEYAQYIKDWKDEGKIVYVYFNNTMGDAVNNLITMNRYLSYKSYPFI